MRKLSIWMLQLALSAQGASAASNRLPFIEDDYAAALREAKERKLPMFVEVSAPW
jgi:hypothetical protein